MFGSAILDVAIGLIFVFLVMSLIVTAVSELIASKLKLRASNLEEGIRNLLHPRSTNDSATPAEDLTKKIFDHPLVNSLSRPGDKPSYIPSRTFALSLIDVISKLDEKAPKAKEDVKALIASLPNEELKKSLTVLAEEAEQDLEKLKVNIEVWFNNSMDRVSGWYKRRTQFIHVALGIVFAVALNVDTFLIARTLANDSALRDSLVAQAQEFAKKTPDANTDSKKEIEDRIKQLGGLGLPIGWTDEPVPGLRKWPGWIPGTKESPEPDKPDFDKPVRWGELWGQTLRYHIIGWLLTGFAASLGAPFWFDLLNKFMNLRSAGKAPEEEPKEPKKQPKPLGPGETAEEQREKDDEAPKK